MALYQGENQKMTGSANSTNRFISGAENLQKIADRIVRNDDLCKLLTRYNQNVLDDETPVTNAERKELLTSRIKTVPVLEKEQEIGAYIIISIGTVTSLGSTGLNYNITFDILCNSDIWSLNGYIPRPYYIMNEIDSMFHDTKMKGIGPMTFMGAAPIKINEKMFGYTMLFNVGDI